MAGLRRKLPPLTGLTVFEAAARLGSFTKAAAELGVTQAAVSRQIHLLEDIFGFPLFRRLHRKIEVTDKGRLLSSATTTAFNLIADTIADISKEEGGDELAISATVAFSHFWLLPRISSFARSYPQVKLRIITQDKSADIEGGDVDLVIRYGNGMWPDGQAEFLFDDEIFPVCSPEYASEIGQVATLADLIRYPLITHDTDDPAWTGWNEWLAAFSVQGPKRPTGLRCSFYTEAIYAALNGQGIALGWKRLVEDLLNQKRLVRLTDASISTRNGYFVVVPRRQRKKEYVELLIEWLKRSTEVGHG
ncbi:DNA-binding transcriptional LysR family regulator [Sinorhizobium fredii]|uniref:Glycine cleavage system transcriptional activator n=1 Tax=Sinorhizobium fredii (strain USDA 257) TaxID=1185652 RepID=I3X5N7_SINF2|nr:LysR substrate-binding domain-containing protein [Sinorhizobium fredii]AFL51193.1 glycine cleavage system transcriptional activator [Sinorhizobium fredii USDA 257]